MSIKQRIDDLNKDFSRFGDWEDKYKHIIMLGKKMPTLPDDQKSDQLKVKGCQSQVWLHADLQDGKIVFLADSDASIVKGIIAILLSVYNEVTPDEILNTSPKFLDEIGLKEHLSMSRANGLNAMIKQISLYAMAFKAKENMQKM